MREYCSHIQQWCYMTRKLPEFTPVTLLDLRRIWTEHEDHDIRRLTLEVERYRRAMAEIDHLYATIHQAWRDEVGGELVALHLLKQVLYVERERLA